MAVYPLRGHHEGVGWDTSFYTWWARQAGEVGLSGPNTGSRPAMVGFMATLSGALRVPEAWIAAVVGPVLAAALGLAAAALVEEAFGADRLRFVLTALLVGTYLSLMALGYFSTLAFGACFVAGLASLTAGVNRRRWRPTVAGAVLVGVGGLAHPRFLPVAAALLGAGVIGLIPAARRDLAAGRGLLDTAAGRVSAALIGGAALTGVGLAAARGASGPVLDTTRDGLLRRVGVGSEAASFRAVLRSYLSTAGPTAAAAGGFLLGAPRDEPGAASDRRRFLWGVLAGWVALTVGAVALLLAGRGVPGQRLVAMCIPLPVLAGLGLSRLVGRTPADRRPVSLALAAGAVLLLGSVYWVNWNVQTPVPAAALEQVRSLGRLLAVEPPGTPLVVVDGDRRDPAWVVEHANQVREAVPPGRIPDVHVVFGRPSDVLAGSPTTTGSPVYDALSRDSLRRARPALNGSSLVVVVQGFDPAGYREAIRLPGHRVLAPGVVALPGFGGDRLGSTGPPPREGALTRVGGIPFSPWVPVALAPGVLVLLALIGWPWVQVTARWRGPRVRGALAPAFGLAALSAFAVLVDASGARLAGSGGPASLAVAAGAGLAALWLGRGPDGRGSAPDEHEPVGVPVGEPPAGVAADDGSEARVPLP